MKEMVKELKEFGVEAYGYDPLLSKEEIGRFGVKALDNLDVKIDCVIVAVAHDEFKNKSFLSTGSFFQTVGKFNHQTFKKGLIQTNAFSKSLTKNAARASQKESVM